jgi:hypothetical protein
MNLKTPLMAAAILLSGAALHAGASPLCAERVCAAVYVDGLHDIAGPIGGVPDVDLDNDGYPDILEVQLCSREVVRNIINTETVPGTCVSQTDFDGTDIGTLVGGVIDFVDRDRDFIPDAIEPSMCSVEAQGDPTDGECSADRRDYDPPLI